MRLIALIILTVLFCRSAFALDIFMAPTGNDALDGNTQQSAIATLERAHELAAEALDQTAQDIHVHVTPGKYDGQTVVWRATSPDFQTVISGPEGKTQPAVFDGTRQGTTFFILDRKAAEATNVTIRNLTITNYRTAVSFAGNRRYPGRWSSNNNLLNNRFIDNGGTAMEPMGNSTAVVRLVNSRQNVISGNAFDGMIGKNCRLLHAIYLAHGSDRNTITDNIFRNGCGDPIRVRDGSNFNVIHDNQFDRVGVNGAYNEWYCNSKTACARDECPPLGNAFFDNKLGTRYDGRPLPPSFNFRGPPRAACATMPDAQTQFKAFGNTNLN